MLKKLPFAIALIGMHGLFAHAGASDGGHPVQTRGQLNDIAVHGRHIADDAAATETVVTREELIEKGARNIKDALRDEVDVMVRTRPSNFSATRSATGRARNEAINIRGIEGNRVLIVQDGIRLPNGFSFGPAFQTGRGDYWEVDSFRKIEILRGANSTQYGADSLAGVVSVTTLGPRDLIGAGKNAGGFVQSSYAQQDNSFNHSAGVAFDDDRWQGMFMGTLRSGHETWSQENDRSPNSNRTAPNPVNMESRYYLSKIGFKMNASNRLQATLENLNLQVDTNALNQVSPTPAFRATRSMHAYDTTERKRLSLEYFHDGKETDWLHRLHAHLYWQDSSIRQLTRERVFGPVPTGSFFQDFLNNWFFENQGAFLGAVAPPRTVQRLRDNRYSDKTIGFNVVADIHFRTGQASHSLRHGFDVSYSSIAMSLGGTVPAFGYQFPRKSSPDSTYLLAGGFVQDEISISQLKIIPGLRYDFFRLVPDGSSLSDSDKRELLARQAAFARRSDHAFTPRLGLIWEITSAFTPYANYAKGFRAPTPEQLNANYFGQMPFWTYLYSGNPDLKPERVTGMEIGARGAINGFRYSFAAFESRYRDFIQNRVVGDRADVGAMQEWKSVNENRAYIRGFEVRSEWDINAAWRANAAIAYARGDVEESIYAPPLNWGQPVRTVGKRWAPMNSIQPMRAIIGARYRQAGWGAHANLEHAWGKAKDRIAGDASNSTARMTRPYSVVNAGVWVEPFAGFTARLNVENIFNAYYARWSDIGPEDATSGNSQSTNAIRYATAPPRSLQLALRYTY
ncbi:TonB-dependent hemoglobin/transferrin/lactoferrin family receptor [Herbaspirillum sp.]|uniref:TonB-dependent hemoglobin/transferrin/lactoferrin family receptor n=1 Tax=Herbaspirillum sp. TaxID=1890675 RepID=UPI0031CED584